MCSGRNTQTAVRRKDEATNAIKDRNPREGRAGERAASRRRAPTKQLEKPVASDRASGCVKKQTPVTVETSIWGDCRLPPQSPPQARMAAGRSQPKNR